MHSPGDAGLNWFYVREGRRVGPFDRAPLIAQLLALDAPEAVLVWRTGLPAWTKAGLLEELRGELPPPVPGSLPGLEGLQDLQAPDAGKSKAPAEEALPPLPSEPPLSGGDIAGDLGQGKVQGQQGPPGDPENDEAGKRRRRRRRHRPGSSMIPSYLLPLVLLFVAVMLGLWFLLRRMNEPPPGQILHQGALAPTGGANAGPEPTGCLPDASRA